MRYVRRSWPELLIVVLSLAAGLLVLPVDWRLGRWELGMHASTRASLAAGLLTSAVVAGVLAILEHRRQDDAQKADTQRQKATARLADADALSLLADVGHSYRAALRSVAERLGKPGVPEELEGWSALQLGLLSENLVLHLLLDVPGAQQRRSPEGRRELSCVVLAYHMAADGLVQALKSGLFGIDDFSARTMNPNLPPTIEATLVELSRLADALLVQNAPQLAAPLLDLRSEVARFWGIADKHIPWGADLAEVLVAWLTDANPLAIDRETLAEELKPAGDHDEDWMGDAHARQAWLEYHHQRLHSQLVSPWDC